VTPAVAPVGGACRQITSGRDRQWPGGAVGLGGDLGTSVAGVKLRYPTAEITVGDAVLSPGDPVVISVAAANRDPERYPNPDTFDISRADPGHLGFGYGIHFCIGAPLARLEAQIAFETLLSRCQNLALACDPAELSWRVSPIIRGLSRLPVTFTPA
jgi:cytochrome P450